MVDKLLDYFQRIESPKYIALYLDPASPSLGFVQYSLQQVGAHEDQVLGTYRSLFRGFTEMLVSFTQGEIAAIVAAEQQSQPQRSALKRSYEVNRRQHENVKRTRSNSLSTIPVLDLPDPTTALERAAALELRQYHVELANLTD
ncbi:hypothetical protein H9P43_007357 [Blastocladiella emersonii ATCC 22665]|nr:hypothetical protein H9P43_007357 [Blastocladiella emersonii ATCC 22665]